VDEDTQDWLSNMMSNSVGPRRVSQGTAAANAAATSTASAPAPDLAAKTPRPRPQAERAVRKTLIAKAGTGDVEDSPVGEGSVRVSLHAGMIHF
jgi:hypothetical protein